MIRVSQMRSATPAPGTTPFSASMATRRATRPPRHAAQSHVVWYRSALQQTRTSRFFSASRRSRHPLSASRAIMSVRSLKTVRKMLAAVVSSLQRSTAMLQTTAAAAVGSVTFQCRTVRRSMTSLTHTAPSTVPSRNRWTTSRGVSSPCTFGQRAPTWVCLPPRPSAKMGK